MNPAHATHYARDQLKGEIVMNKKSNIGNIISWLFALLFFVIGVLNLWLVHNVPGIFYLILSIFYYPPTNKLFRKKLSFSFLLAVKK